MSETFVSLDPINPAQFFACCGLFELLAMRIPEVLTHFQHDPRTPRRADFVVPGVNAGHVVSSLRALKTARVEALPDFAGGEAPVRIVIPEAGKIELDWWLAPTRTDTSDLKLWAGRQTTNKLVRDMRDALPDELDERPLDFPLPMSGRFGLDPRSAWNALDFGSSPNTQGRDAYTFPVTEMLAAIGLQGFRPKQVAPRQYAYWLWDSPLPLVAARAACGGVLTETSGAAFRFQVVKRSKSYSFLAYAQPHHQED